jgi:cold shock CspA family protein
VKIDATPDASGQPGRILRLNYGGHGYIQANEYREVFFHRADTDGAFPLLHVGDDVTFELIEDGLNRSRAIRVRRKAPEKRRA